MTRHAVGSRVVIISGVYQGLTGTVVKDDRSPIPYLVHVDASSAPGLGKIWLIGKRLRKLVGGGTGDVVQSSSLRDALAYLDDVKLLLREKNAAYGDSAGNPVRIFSRSGDSEQLLVRIDDKLSRIARGPAATLNEEVINDLIGYLALLGGSIRRKGNE